MKGVMVPDTPPPWRPLLTGERKTTDVVIKWREELRGALAGQQRTNKNTNIHKKGKFEASKAKKRRETEVAVSVESSKSHNDFLCARI